MQAFFERKRISMLEFLQDPFAFESIDCLLARGAAKRAGITLADHADEMLSVIETAICRLPENAATDAALNTISDLRDAKSDAERDDAFTQAQVAVFDLGDEVFGVLLEWREVDLLRRRSLSGEVDATTARIAADATLAAFGRSLGAPVFAPGAEPPGWDADGAGIFAAIVALAGAAPLPVMSPDPTPKAPAVRTPIMLRQPRPALAPLTLARDMRPRLTAGGTLIKGLLDEGAMSVIYAPSNVGKSFLMLDVAFHIATGMDWRGLKIKKPGAVLYIASEGGYGFVNRVVAIKRYYGLADDANIPLAVLPCPVDLLDPKADRDTIVDLIDSVSQEFGKPVVLVVLDTLSRIMAGGDENGPKDMTAVVANIDAIRQRSNAHTAIVHHAGKDVAKGARGHSSLRAATDTEIELTRTGEGDDKSFTVAVRKQRELPGDNVFRCTLKSVHLGNDDDGEPVTSAVVDNASADDPGIAGGEGRKTPNETALDILASLIASKGYPLPKRDGYPAGLYGVDEELWRHECESQRLSTAEKESSRDRAFRRAYESLRFTRKVGARNGLVWTLPPDGRS
jgi:hypothetical protein